MENIDKLYLEAWKTHCLNYNYKQTYVLPPAKRIIVIGDIHGDYDILISNLKLGKVIDNSNNWIGKDTIVVQIGDQIDRYRYDGIHYDNKVPNDKGEDLKILYYMTNLHDQALKQGGAVYSLIGNHELMNIEQRFDYVSEEGFKEFDSYLNKQFVSGYEARKWAFNKGNPLSNFIACTRQVAIIIGSNLFVHAGILPHVAEKYKDINNINKLMSLYLLNYIKSLDDYDLYSILWTRVFGEDTKVTDYDICNSLLNPLKTIYNVNNIIVGHTPNFDGIKKTCNGRVINVDYGASVAFNMFKRPEQMYKAEILEINNDNNFVILR